MKTTSHSDIWPFHFPTTTVVVDDHEEYLNMVPLMLDPMLRVHTFSSPRMALARLGSSGSQSVPGGGWMFRWKDRPSATKELVALDIDSIHRIVYDPERFAEVSVVVVDQTMPEMDGISFFRQLNNPNVGKILLTGRADDSTAIEAFNAGMIDRFIRKQDPAAGEKLQEAIAELQQQYFSRVGAFVAETLALGDFSFLRAPAVLAAVRKLIEPFRPVECYVHVNPSGLLFLDADGTGRFVMVQSDDDLRTHYEIASDQGASRIVLAALLDESALPWFESRDGFYQRGMENTGIALYPATAVQADRMYYCAVVDRVQRFELDKVKSYRSWLLEQDRAADRHTIPHRF